MGEIVWTLLTDMEMQWEDKIEHRKAVLMYLVIKTELSLVLTYN